MSDDSTPDVVATPDSTESVVLPESDLQDTSRPRHWRQRYAGPDGDYVFRSRMVIKGPGGETHRVERGERVDAAAAGISPRRLKALWYSNNIELADPSAPRAGSRKHTKVVVDNIEIQRQEAVRETAALRAAKHDNELRKQMRAQAREEARQRDLADQAVKAAEAQELREMQELGLEDDREAFEALVQARIAQAAEKAAEDAELEKQLAEERAELAKIRAAERAKVDAEKAAERAKSDAERREKKAARAEARVARITGTRRFNESLLNVSAGNPHTERISAGDATRRAKAAVGRPNDED